MEIYNSIIIGYSLGTNHSRCSINVELPHWSCLSTTDSGSYSNQTAVAKPFPDTYLCGHCRNSIRAG